MTPYQREAENEKHALDIKIKKLAHYIQQNRGIEPAKVDCGAEQLGLMVQQLEAMEFYSHIIGQRIGIEKSEAKRRPKDAHGFTRIEEAGSRESEDDGG